MQTLQQTNTAPSVGMKRLEQHCKEQRGELLRLAMRWLHDWQLAEDVLQEASLRAFDAIHRGLYDVSRPFAPWFLRIVRRLSYNKLTRQVRPEREHLLSMSQFTSELADICGHLIAPDEIQALIEEMDGSPEQDALRATWHCLSENEQQLLTAAYVEERPFNELAAEQGCTPEALRNRLMRTRDKARVYILVDMVSEG